MPETPKRIAMNLILKEFNEWQKTSSDMSIADIEEKVWQLEVIRVKAKAGIDSLLLAWSNKINKK